MNSHALRFGTTGDCDLKVPLASVRRSPLIRFGQGECRLSPSRSVLKFRVCPARRTRPSHVMQPLPSSLSGQAASTGLVNRNNSALWLRSTMAAQRSRTRPRVDVRHRAARWRLSTHTGHCVGEVAQLLAVISRFDAALPTYGRMPREVSVKQCSVGARQASGVHPSPLGNTLRPKSISNPSGTGLNGFGGERWLLWKARSACTSISPITQ